MHASALIYLAGLGSLFGELQGASQPQQQRLLIHNVRIFDGDEVIDADKVLVVDGAIAAVGSDVNFAMADEYIDGEGGMLLPGLIDCHVHTFTPQMLEQSLIFGVTTNLDMFMPIAFANQMRAENAGNRADFFTAGTLVTAPRGHGTQFGLPIPTIENPEDAQQFVDDRVAEGSDYIKIVYDGGRGWGGEIPTLDLPTLNAVIDAAHARGKLAVVHVHDQKAAYEATESGADGLVHLFFDGEATPEFVALANERGAFIIPTLTVIQSVTGTAGGASLVDDPHIAPYLSAADKQGLSNGFTGMPEHLKERFAGVMNSVAMLKEAGVPLLAGTDAPNPGTIHGAAIHRELELLVESGLEPIEALRGATSIPADSFGISDRGRIAPGMRADLILVSGDPTASILETRAIVRVWKEGQLVDREVFRARIAAADEAGGGEPGTIPADGAIADFESGQAEAAFGAGWQVSTDAMMGGGSKAEMSIVEGGANGSSHAMRVQGEVAEGFQFPWAGALFNPGLQPFVPVDLSSRKGIAFSVRGDGVGACRVMVFDQSLGRAPAMVDVSVTGEWVEHILPFETFGIEGSGVMAILFSGPAEPGAFAFEIDAVRLAGGD
jgi:imidazolonepropionase-like amidohydrolase